MFDEQASHDTTNVGLELLCDVEMFLGLTCIIPMLEFVQGLSKFAQNQNIFICNFFVVIKECEVQPYQTYCDQYTMYGQKEFRQFLDTMEHSNDVLHHVCLLDQNIRLEYPAFHFYGCIYMQHNQCTVTSTLNQVSIVDQFLVMHDVKKMHKCHLGFN